jgi:hypothetical protein
LSCARLGAERKQEPSGPRCSQSEPALENFHCTAGKTGSPMQERRQTEILVSTIPREDLISAVTLQDDLYTSLEFLRQLIKWNVCRISEWAIVRDNEPLEQLR